MRLTIYQVDAFTDQVFSGNPAAVCPLTEWLSDDLLKRIAKENNLSETAFYIIKNDVVEIRWFTPAEEVDLCGHATLATAFVLSNLENYKAKTIPFYSPRSGPIPVKVQQDHFVLNFPTDQFTEIELTQDLIALTDKNAIAVYKGKTDYMLVFDNQEDVETVIPNLAKIAALQARGVMVTAKGAEADFVSRFFAPAVGVDEDPVCGSAHTTLTPFWSDKLGKKELKAIQLSKRGGEIGCRLTGGRVELSGKAVLYLKGEIFI